MFYFGNVSARISLEYPHCLSQFPKMEELTGFLKDNLLRVSIKRFDDQCPQKLEWAPSDHFNQKELRTATY